MGDRRKGDRRAPEDGVIKIQKKNILAYTVLTAVLIFVIVLNIVLWVSYIRYRNQYNIIVDHYYNDNSNINNTTNEKNMAANNNYTCEITINEDTTKKNTNESITYEIKATKITASDGIKSFETYIDYDTNVFECKVEGDDEGEWSKTAFLEGYLTMNKSNFEASSQDQVIAKITFIAKKGLFANNYQAKLTNIKFTTGDNQVFEVGDNNIDIKLNHEN